MLTDHQFLNRAPLREKPTAHISYHEGLRLIRRFLEYASQHTVEDLQAFTGQWVPTPTWVRTDDILISQAHLKRSAELLQAQLGHRGLDKVGGKLWWQWRRPETPLKAEWIEMRKDYNDRVAQGDPGQRIMLYVHGGAYYFGSVDEHRYQMQRHARKLKARVLAPRYRLAPQFPFPCGLHDCIATYLQLLQEYDPSKVLLAGDSAGGGMVLAMLVTLRDQQIPLPAGAILLSPWVDLTHSFPSLAGDGAYDYIPPYGFHHRPSMAWPPPSAADMRKLAQGAVESLIDTEKRSHLHHGLLSTEQKAHLKKEEEEEKEAIRGFSVEQTPMRTRDATIANNQNHASSANQSGGSTEHNLSIMMDGNLVEIQEQIQMYTTNQLLAHPLVSPVMQPSLGGLPPLLIQTGGGELLRDEQIYLAHKAANPPAYPPTDAILDEFDPERKALHEYPPTDVHLQVWDDLCHVAPTLSFTRPAKFMFRSVAQFGAWALAHAQHKKIDIVDDDAVSIISSTDTEAGSDVDRSHKRKRKSKRKTTEGKEPTAASVPIHAHHFSTANGAVGKAGDPLPPFENHMIRQRVDRHGVTYPLPAPSELEALNLDPATIGVVKPGPVRKWLAKHKEFESKFGKEKRAVRKQRIREMSEGYDTFEGEEVPPPTALAGRRRGDMPAEVRRKGKSWGLAMWSGWGSKHDQDAVEREGRSRTLGVVSVGPAPGEVERSDVANGAKAKIGKDGAGAESPSAHGPDSPSARPRSTTPFERATQQPPALLDPNPDPNPTMPHKAGVLPSPSAATSASLTPNPPLPAPGGPAEATKVPGSENTYLSAHSARPHNGAVAYPFKLRSQIPELQHRNASTTTLDSAARSEDQVSAMDATGTVSEADDASAAAAAAARGMGAVDGAAGTATEGSGGKEVVVENGEVREANRAERPKLESFVTARETL